MCCHAAGCSTTACCVRYSLPRSIPIRPTPRRRSQAPSCARRWRREARRAGHSSPQDGLGTAFVDPAIAYLRRHGVEIRFDHQLRALDLADDRVRALEFGEDKIDLGNDDAVILAVPGWVAPLLIKGLSAPRKFSAILNAHFKIAAPLGFPNILGVLNATTEWVFAFPDRISVTVSAADRFIEAEREPLARQIWSEVAGLTGQSGELPPWHLVKERRATFAALPQENARRPSAANTLA